MAEIVQKTTMIADNKKPRALKPPKHPRRVARGKASHRRGWRAEWAALAYLLLRGYWPRALRYRVPGGEVDIIVQRGKLLAAVEVKARPDIITGHETMNDREWRRRAAAMDHFMRRYAFIRNQGKNFSVRFDLVVVTPYFQIQHLEAAWRPEF